MESKKSLAKIILLGVALSSFLYFAEAFFYPGFVQRYLHIPLTAVAVPILVAIVLFRVITKSTLDHFYQRVLVISAAAAIYLHMLTWWLDFYFYANFSLSHLHLNPEPLMPLGLFLLVASILTLSKDFVKANRALLTFISGQWVFAGAFLLSRFNQDLFWHLAIEDSVFEYSTFVTFIIASLFSFKIFETLKENYEGVFKKALLVIFVFAPVGFFVIAGEEISWAQRLLGIETPEEIKAINTQEEITLHNHVVIIKYVYLAYNLLGIYCSVSWLLSWALFKFGKDKKLAQVVSLFTPPGYLMSYFVPVVVYTIVRHYQGYTYVARWEEFMELMLAMGLAIFMFDTLKKSQKLK